MNKYLNFGLKLFLFICLFVCLYVGLFVCMLVCLEYSVQIDNVIIFKFLAALSKGLFAYLLRISK